ncbi:MAG: choice-of-anchor B family protein [Flavobacteriales bacterium]
MLCLFLLFVFTAKSQQSLNINLLSNLDYNNDLSDVWGYANDAGEYALVGVYNGISVVDVTNPYDPVELGFFNGPESIWRDLKTWGNYLYCINDEDGDGGAGLQILNLEELINGVNNPTYIENMSLGFETAHNIYIDENGVLYVFGADYGIGGALMYDLVANPENPPLLGVFNDYYLHDGMARGDTLWGGAINDGVFTVIDVSDKQNPSILGSHATPNNFSHNCWISDDGDYLFTTDEVSGAYVAAYDVSNLNDIEEVDRIQAWSPQTNVIPHNTHVDGDFIVTSYYADGVSVVDVSNPSNMVEVGYYDTSEDYSGGGFNGAWGAYPWLPSGNILVTDIEAGLYVLEPKYTNASFVEGVVTDSNTGLPISNAQIQILGTSTIVNTDLGGYFETGVAVDGTYELLISSSGYADDVQTVVLNSGQIINLDTQLSLLGSYNTQLSVVNALNLNGLSQASVHIANDLVDYQLSSSTNGELSIILTEGTYSISIGLWGYQTLCSEFTVSESQTDFIFELDRAYSDDFSVDLGWVVESDASLESGLWERAIPVSYSNMSTSPNQDVDGDCGDYAFITDNGEYETVDFDVEDQNWGGSLNASLTASLIHVDDQVNQSCEPTSYELSGSIALIKRGACQFGLKALNAENAGAVAVIIYNNNNSGQPLGLGAGDDSDDVTIPVFSISGADGNDIVDFIESAGNFYATLNSDNLTISISSPSFVSGGTTRFISPLMDLTYHESPILSFNTWFQNIGDENSEDSLLVRLSNGIETVLIDYRTAESSGSEWVIHDVSVNGFIELTNQMQIIVEAHSQYNLEAGFDNFLITSSNMNVASHDPSFINIYPNPSLDGVIQLDARDHSTLLVYDISGGLLFEKHVSKGLNKLDLSFLASGTYLINLVGDLNSSTSVWIRN